MRIPITCVKCGNDFSAPESFVGRKVVCPSCGKGVRVTETGNGIGSGERSPARQSGNSGRSGGRRLKLGLGVVGGVAVVVLIAMALENLPSLSQLNLASLQGQNAPPPSAELTPVAPNSVSENSPDNASPPEIRQPPTPLSETKPARAEPAPKRPPNADPKQVPKPNRAMASEEFDSDRGRQLFANVKRVVIVRGGKVNKNQDPRGAIWNEAVANGRRVIEKLGLDFSTGNPGPDAAVLTVTLEIQPSKKGTPGTKEISVSAELTCADPAAESSSRKYAKVWKAEQELGSISAKSSKAGKLPNSVEDQMTKFFGKFRNAYNQAVQAEKDDGKAEQGA